MQFGSQANDLPGQATTVAFVQSSPPSGDGHVLAWPAGSQDPSFRDESSIEDLVGAHLGHVVELPGVRKVIARDARRGLVDLNRGDRADAGPTECLRKTADTVEQADRGQLGGHGATSTAGVLLASTASISTSSTWAMARSLGSSS